MGSGFLNFLKSQHLSLYIYEVPNGFLKLASGQVIEPRESLLFSDSPALHQFATQILVRLRRRTSYCLPTAGIKDIL